MGSECVLCLFYNLPEMSESSHLWTTRSDHQTSSCVPSMLSTESQYQRLRIEFHFRPLKVVSFIDVDDNFEYDGRPYRSE